MTIDPRLSYYSIYLYNHDGERVFFLTRYEFLEYAQRINDSWNHMLRIEYSPEDEDLTFFRETLQRDYIIEIVRYDVVTEEYSTVYEGFHRTLVDQIKQNGVVVLTLYGTGYTQLLKRRIVLPATGEENSEKTGPAETCIKEFVDEQCVNPTDTDRVIQGLSIQTDEGLGNTATYSARFTNLYTVVKRLAEQGEIDFGIIKDTSVGTFSLRTAELWGTDRRRDNPDGVAPTIFDVTLNNMLIPILSKRGTDEVNHVYIGGQGQGVNRALEEEENATAKAVSPWARAEAFVDARSESTSTGLTTRGQSYLQEHGATVELTFNLEQTEGTRWLRDWELGDVVTAYYGDLTFSKKIVEVHVVVSAGQTGQAVIEVITAEMEDYDQTFRAWRLGIAGRSELDETTYLGF